MWHAIAVARELRARGCTDDQITTQFVKTSWRPEQVQKVLAQVRWLTISTAVHEGGATADKVALLHGRSVLGLCLSRSEEVTTAPAQLRAGEERQRTYPAVRMGLP